MSNSVVAKELTYNPRFFDQIAKVEKRHFWFSARNRIIAAALRNLVSPLLPGYRVLEVGCGTGIVLGELRRVCRDGEVVGMDLYPEAVQLAQRHSKCPVVIGDIMDPPDLGQFDIVGLFDVLEHLPDDRWILRRLHEFLTPNGALILTVPAHMSLWSYFDVASCHCRRYELVPLLRMLEEENFEVEYFTHFMLALYPLMRLVRRAKIRPRISKGQGVADMAAAELKIVPVLNSLLELMLGFDAIAVRRRYKVPFGTSFLVVARPRPIRRNS